MKSLNKQNNMLFSTSMRLGSRRQLKKTKKIKSKAPKKHFYSIRDIYSSDYDSYLSSDSEWDKRRQTTERKKIKKLDNVVKNKTKNKYQCNETIEYDPKFDGKFNLSSGTKDTLPAVTVSPHRGKKHR